MNDIRDQRSDDDATLAKALMWAAVLAASWIIGSVLVQGREVLIPIAVAIMIWQLINGIARLVSKLSIGGKSPRPALCLTTAISIILMVCWLVVEIVASNVAQVGTAAPAYEANLREIMHHFLGEQRMAQFTSIEQILEQVDIRAIVTGLTTTLGGLVGNAGLVALYVIFLLAEQTTFDRKIDRLFEDQRRREKSRALLSEIEYRIERYLWIKTSVSVVTAVLCYGVLYLVDVDYAGFWALVVFLFNYIPNIGSLFAVVLPSILAVLQFGSLATGIGVMVALSGIQFVVGSIIEPKMMGSSLNLSPLVIVLSLTLWGSIWGVAGMFLCVPMTVSIMIVLSYFELTRPVAILLSSDGRIGR